MTYVFVVSEICFYESAEIFGVFDSPEKAESYVGDLIADQKAEKDFKKLPGLKVRYVHEGGSWCYEIQRWEVE